MNPAQCQWIQKGNKNRSTGHKMSHLKELDASQEAPQKGFSSKNSMIDMHNKGV